MTPIRWVMVLCPEGPAQARSAELACVLCGGGGPARARLTGNLVLGLPSAGRLRARPVDGAGPLYVFGGPMIGSSGPRCLPFPTAARGQEEGRG